LELTNAANFFGVINDLAIGFYRAPQNRVNSETMNLVTITDL